MYPLLRMLTNTKLVKVILPEFIFDDLRITVRNGNSSEIRNSSWNKFGERRRFRLNFTVRSPFSTWSFHSALSENDEVERAWWLHWSTLSSRRYKHRCVFIYKCTNGLIDFDFNLRTNNSIHSYNTRSCKNLHLPKANTNWGKHKPSYLASKDFNNLDESVRNSNSLYRFKSLLNSRPM